MLILEGPTGTIFGPSRWPRAVHARVPFPAASVTAQPSRFHGDIAARRRYVAVKTRVESREASERGRYLRAELLANLRRSARRAGKVEHIQRALCLIVTTHLRCMPSEHPFMLELASSPLVKLPCSPPRTIQAFGRLARKGGCKSSATSGSVGSASPCSRPLAGCLLWAWAAAERMLRQRILDFLAPPCKRCCVLAAARGSTSSRPHLGIGLYSTDSGDWKLWCCLLGALGKDQSNSHVATAIR